MATPVNIKYQVNGNDKLKAIYDAIEKGDLLALKKAYDQDYFNGKAIKEGSKKAALSKLLLATLYQNPNIVSFLALARKDGQYDLQHRNEDGQNALIEAIKSHQVEIVEIFARVITYNEHLFIRSFKDSRGNTPFHYVGEIADANVRKQMATALIRVGMRIDLKNNAGEKPKHYDELVTIKKVCAQRFQQRLFSTFLNLFFFRLQPPSTEIFRIIILSLVPMILLMSVMPSAFVSILISAMAYVALNYLFSYDETVHSKHLDELQLQADVSYMVKQGKLTKDKLLQYQKQGINLKEMLGEPIMIKAARAGHVAQLSLLLEQGEKIHCRAVQAAILRGHIDAVRFLISKSKAMLLHEQDSTICLVTAIKANKPEIFAFLLAKGAKVSAYVHLFAKQQEHKEIITMLEKAAKPAAKAPAKVVTPNFTAKKQQARKAITVKKPHVVEKPTINPRRQSLRSAKK